VKDKSNSARTTSVRRKVTGFTGEEKSAMQQRVKELQSGKEDGESALLAKLDKMSESDRALGKRLHKIIKASAPGLTSTLWYGMPAYARNGKVICFFQNASKFKTRYATLGFSDKARLDDGAFWPVAYALTQLTAADEARIGALVEKAARG
jgi:uncharacterized protein YdhG (YjbR/CyaY superfamily)